MTLHPDWDGCVGTMLTSGGNSNVGDGSTSERPWQRRLVDVHAVVWLPTKGENGDIIEYRHDRGYLCKGNTVKYPNKVGDHRRGRSQLD